MGNVTVSITGRDRLGTRELLFGTITMSASYATGGDSLALALLGMANLEFLFLNGDDGYVPQWDRSTTAPKILLYEAAADGGALDEVAQVDHSGRILPFIAIGSGLGPRT
jgi:hypothetical protein